MLTYVGMDGTGKFLKENLNKNLEFGMKRVCGNNLLNKRFMSAGMEVSTGELVVDPGEKLVVLVKSGKMKIKNEEYLL